MTIDLYLLPPSLKSCKPVDSSDIRYLNHSHSPIVNPLSKPLNIELYNDTWIDKPPRISQPLFDYNHLTLAFPDDQLTPFTSLSDFHAGTNTIPSSPFIDKSDTDILSPHSPLVYRNLCLHLMVYSSSATALKILLNRDGSLNRSIVWKQPS